MEKVDLSVSLGSLKLKNPVMPASGTFDLYEDNHLPYDTKVLGAVITKTIFLERRLGNPSPRICESASGLINALGTPGEGVEYLIKNKLPVFQKANKTVIVSIGGDGAKEFKLLAERLDKVEGIAALELDLSCPNNEDNIIIAKDEFLTEQTVAKVKEAFTKPIIIKLSPNVNDITKIAKAAQRGGADILSLINTLSAMAIDIKTKKPVLGNKIGGLSGPAIKPIALKMVWDVAHTIDLPIIGIGGISNSEDAIEFLLAGASAIEVGTAALINPLVMLEIIQGIEQYLVQQGYSSIEEIIGLAFK
ncbi:MAG: dihydroorotate dehydrogenase B catalytic subunit [Actinobacteria bacterium RBG_13_35_12]|jgi:dihydroorotate dehydrogenase (NAD+) catalytic subunit|nr:MAG: dihydroorotate dehydrogenase B catalytic subunit [Actinobacteria bacterium RBG_13_35_12]